MIPTTLSTSTSTGSIIGGSNNGSGSASSASSSNGSTSTTKELVVGIASLILEGRAFVDDEMHMLSLRQGTPSPPRGPSTDNDSLNLLSSSSSMMSSVGAFYTGRQSPKPSTSKAATNVQHLINITTNPHHAFCAFTAPLFIETPTSYHSSSSAASSAESTHQRWTQKLCQLRQASPAASLTGPYEQKVAIEAAQGASGGEPEVVALALHDPNTTTDRSSGCGEFEIVRRVILSRSIVPAGAGSSAASISGIGASGSASSSPSSGSDNFLHSLQSLATTCLRGNSPSSMDTSTGYHFTTTTPSSGYASMVSPKYATYRSSTPRFQSPFTSLDLQPGSASSSGSGVQSPKMVTACHSRTKEFSLPRQSNGCRMSTPTSTVTSCSSVSGLNVHVSNLPSTKTSSLSVATPATATSSTLSSSSSNSTASSSPSSYPQQGPHCDQFLRKMGLAKGESAEAEDHYCDMSYVNITCSRWRAYCLKMEAIIERCEPICIEVYLGPIGHKVLLEQWIFTFKEKVPPPTMTLPSLCSAIRSQLYFSQISAWCDLIRKCDKSIYDTGRVIFATSTMRGCAGDLATLTSTNSVSCNPLSTTTTNITPGTSPNSTTASTSLDQLTNAMLNQRPRLNLFYRIKQYDSTACFNSKPTIHNFPNVNISENCSISVCLKSLPRINGGIPKLGAMMSVPNENPTGGTNAVHQTATPVARSQLSNVTRLTNEKMPLSRGKAMAAVLAASAAASAGVSSANSNCDKQKLRANGGGGAPVGFGVGIGVDVDVHGGHAPSNGTEATSFNRYNNNCQEMTTSSMCAPRRVLHNESVRATAASVAPCTSYSSSSQKCTFFIDESELGVDGDGDADADDIGDLDYMSDNANEIQCSNGSCGSLSHRKKQLLKYRKRMLKRDKKQQQQRKPYSSIKELNGGASCGNSASSQPMEQGDDDEDESEQSSVALVTARHVVKMVSTGTQTLSVDCCQRCGNTKSLVCLKCRLGNRVSSEEDMQQQDGVDEMDACSVNSLSSSEIISTPRSKGDLLLQAIQRTPKAAKHKQQAARSTGALNGESSTSTLNVKMRATLSGGSLSNSLQQQNNNQSNTNSTNAAINGITPSSSNSSLTSSGSGCQVCKRQKTQHNFGSDNNNQQHQQQQQMAASEGTEVQQATCVVSNGANEAEGDEEEQDGGKLVVATLTVPFHSTLSEMHNEDKQTPPKTPTVMPRTSTEIMDEECFVSSTKLTPHFDRCALSSTRSARSSVTMVSASNSKPVGMHTQCQNHTASFTKRCYTPPMPLQLNVDCEFKTPMESGSPGSLPFQHKPTPKPNLLQVASVYGDNEGFACSSSGSASQDYNSLQMRKGLPKVNLTPIFCSSTGNGFGCNNSTSCYNDNINGSQLATGGCGSPSPDTSAFSFDDVTLNRVKFERAAAAAKIVANNNNNSNSNLNNSINNNTAIAFDNAVPVQKSYSAPTLPNSPNSLSPRFAKQAAFYKRRSRHLSDRSDRSSLGSDEQYSDEDLDCGGNLLVPSGIIYNNNGSGSTSPMKQRSRLAVMFNRQPLLGNLEECLLQKRIQPKTEVNGFKVLLGASGGFCPMQLTIPAAAYFYELHGETLSTPYVCDIRLPRKGYSVPRTGNIQATLLNPLGTVVRMFVIPYDMRDMPPLHQTFIRQRILADTSKSNSSNNNSRANRCDSKSAFSGGDNKNVSSDHGGGGSGGGGGGGDIEDKNLGHFISAEHMKRLRYSIHLRFQTSRSGRLMLHTDIRLLISRRTDCDTAAAHAKGLLEAPNELITDTVMPSNPKYSVRQDVVTSGAGSSRI